MLRLNIENLEELFLALKENGYKIVGPTLRDNAIIYAEIQSSRDLPRGYSDTQGPGTYRLEKSGKESYFSYVVGPITWKKFLFPPEEKLFSIKKEGQSFSVQESVPEGSGMAFFGVRSCDIRAIEIQDNIFMGREYVDVNYQRRREKSLVIAVQCTQAAATCFCTSMNTGPYARSGYDLALTEVYSSTEHYLLLESGSDKGKEILGGINAGAATETEIAAGREATEETVKQIERTMETQGLPERLKNNLDHPHWDVIAERCTACANCTMVCPTCFCSTVEDVTDLTGDNAERWRYWDSCFTQEFTYMHGGRIRSSGKSRYRQWMTHKLSSWHEQFDSSGCVGCGRCITWCPVGIDITEEAKAINWKSEDPLQVAQSKES